MKLKILSKFSILILIPIPLILFIFIDQQNKIIIYPNKSLFYLEPIADNYFNGKSKILKINEMNYKLEFSYIIKEGFPYPFAGITFNYKDNTGIDISKYNNIRIKTSSPDTDQFDIRLLYYIDEKSRRDDYTSYLIKSKELKIDKKVKIYNINKKLFVIPMWYYFLKKNINLEKRLDSKKLTAIEIYNSQTQIFNKKASLEIYQISLNKRYNNVFNLIFFIIISLYYLILLFYIFFHNQISKMLKNFNLINKHLNISSIGEEELEKIIKSTQKNFSNGELTINEISQITGITSRRISIILKKKFNLSFRQYLNIIRIEEAKYLITNTDRQLTEIAFFVGYNNSTHFYRIFKKIVGLSPKDFMTKNRQ